MRIFKTLRVLNQRAFIYFFCMKGVANALGIDIASVDLELPKRNSKENNMLANNKHPELDTPTSPVDSGKEIDTNYHKYIEPEEDPWLL